MLDYIARITMLARLGSFLRVEKTDPCYNSALFSKSKDLRVTITGYNGRGTSEVT